MWLGRMEKCERRRAHLISRARRCSPIVNGRGGFDPPLTRVAQALPGVRTHARSMLRTACLDSNQPLPSFLRVKNWQASDEQARKSSTRCPYRSPYRVFLREKQVGEYMLCFLDCLNMAMRAKEFAQRIWRQRNRPSMVPSHGNCGEGVYASDFAGPVSLDISS